MAIKISGNTVIDDSRNITSSGTMSANAYVGDGSQLTNLPGGGNVLQATASGTLANGSTVLVNADGTVSVVAQTGSASPSAGSEVAISSTSSGVTATAYDSTNQRIVIAYENYNGSFSVQAVVGTVNASNNSITFGTPAVISSSNISYIGATFDSTNDRVVVTYMDNGNSNYGTAAVGEVDPSNNSITFGTPVVYNSARSNYPRATFDSTNGKVVFTYQDTGNNSYGIARVGEVSPGNNSISFPSSEVVFEYANSQYIGATFDSTSGKVVIAYTSPYSPWNGKAVVGTVSGTSISFGSSTVFDSSARVEYPEPVYDPSTDRTVIAYRDGNNSNRGVAVVGTVSGTSISFGSYNPVFDSDSVASPSPVYDSVNQKVVIAYSDGGDSYYGKAIIATVYSSNNNITFGSPTTFASGSTAYISAAYDSTNKRIVYAYQDNDNTNDATAAVYAVNTLGTNLTAENFIGISNAAYSDGQTATIQISGSIDDAQSGLTPGQKYYVQVDGSLSTTADTPSVFAGTAVASTKLIING